MTSLAPCGRPGGGLDVSGLTVRFGGHVALSGVSLHAPVGQVTGLLGPNGAGKSTLFNACSGLLNPDEGSVRLLGDDVTSMSPAHRARVGLGRTFQQMELFGRLSVELNVQLGVEALMAGRQVSRVLWQTKRVRDHIRVSRDEAIDLCGLDDLRHRPAGSLPGGQRRLVELARAVAGGYDVLLLDEPSSGLDHTETEEFGGILQQVVSVRGTGILLVEHDISLVNSVCSYAYVLDFGVLIAEGPTSEVMASSAVRSAYLGVEPV